MNHRGKNGRNHEYPDSNDSASTPDTYLTNSERRDYFSNLISENSLNQRKLFRTNNLLLFESTNVSFPDHIPDDLANDFGNYFVQKIERINDSLDAPQSCEPLDGDGDASTDNMGSCANCIVILIRENVQSSQTSRPRRLKLVSSKRNGGRLSYYPR